MGELLVPLQGLLGLVDPPVQHFDVGEHQLQIDGADVPHRVHAAIHMDDVAVFKAAHHMNDHIHLTDVGEEFVSQTLAFGSAFDQTGNIHKFQDGRGDFFGMVNFCQSIQPFIGHINDAHIGIDGAEGIVGRLGLQVGQCVKKGALAHIGQAHDT